MADNEDLIDQFCAITGSDRNLAANLLEACNSNLEMAINMHMENESAPPAPALAPPQASAALQRSISPSLPAGPSAVERNGEVSGDIDEDGVRAPIPQTQETLVEAGYEGYEMQNRRHASRAVRVRSVFDGFRNFEEETRRLEERGGETIEPPGYSKSKKRTLEDLFKPPLDIMFQGDWQSARDSAANSGRWLLVNIQDPKEFQCQVLNRDLWSHDGVKSIVSEHFIFWQQYRQSDEAQRYMTFYKITNWPYISVIDPRTGENMITWNKMDAGSFAEIITEFLSLHPTIDSNGSQPPRKRQKVDEGGSSNIAEMDEEAQMAAAIKASLEQMVSSKDTEENDDGDNIELSDFDDTVDTSKDSLSETPRGEKSKLESLTTPVNGEHNGPIAEDGGQNGKDEEIGWRKYLGEPGDELTNILIRFPDGEKDPWNYPATSKLKALIEYIGERGYPSQLYEVLTNFPRRIITKLDLDKTLKDVELCPRETVFVQLKDED